MVSKSHGSTKKIKQGHKGLLLIFLLIFICISVSVVHWPALSSQALSFDDEQYLSKNILVKNPSWASVVRFFTEVLEPSTVQGYYQPLTMISLMADYAQGGRSDNLRCVHRTSLILHTLNTALVVLLLYLLFDRVWAAAAAGLLFGLHPITVEMICWVSNRKDLLAVFFSLLSLIYYVKYTKNTEYRIQNSVERHKKSFTTVYCLLATVFYLLALLSKPAATPLPVLMLLLDYWPLGRLKLRTVWEKAPLFAFMAVSAVITYVSQNRAADLAQSSWNSPQDVLWIICHNTIFYLYKIVWPADLSLFYAFPKTIGWSNPVMLVSAAGTCVLILLLVISLRWTPAAMTSWLFFFVAVFPTMGLIKFTNVIAADRYIYFPSIGLLMALAVFIGWFCRISVYRCAAVTAAVLLAAGFETAATGKYLSYWHNSVSINEYMLKIDPDAVEPRGMLGVALSERGRSAEAAGQYNRVLAARPDDFRTHNNLANLLQAEGKLDEAVSHYRQALQVAPGDATTRNNLGSVLQAQGRLDEAIACYRQALQNKSQYAEAHNNLGNALILKGGINEAISHFRQALQIKPDSPEMHYNLANALQSKGELNEASDHFRRAIELKPDYLKAYNNLGNLLQSLGNFDDALAQYSHAIEINPDYPAALNGMAQILAMHPKEEMRNMNQAVEFAERAAGLTQHKDAAILDNLAAIYASTGRLQKAVSIEQEAVDLAAAKKDEKLLEHTRRRLMIFKQLNEFQNRQQDVNAPLKR